MTQHKPESNKFGTKSEYFENSVFLKVPFHARLYQVKHKSELDNSDLY